MRKGKINLDYQIARFQELAQTEHGKLLAYISLIDELEKKLKKSEGNTKKCFRAIGRLRRQQEALNKLVKNES